MTKAASAANTQNTGMREIFIPKGPAREQQTKLISVNGKNYFLPMGKRSLVPEAVAQEYERSLEAQEAYDTMCERLQERAKKQ